MRHPQRLFSLMPRNRHISLTVCSRCRFHGTFPMFFADMRIKHICGSALANGKRQNQAYVPFGRWRAERQSLYTSLQIGEF